MNTFSEYQNIIEKALNRNEISKGLNESRRYTGLAGPTSLGRYTFSDYVSNRSQLSFSADLVAIANKMGAVPLNNQVIAFSYVTEHFRC